MSVKDRNQPFNPIDETVVLPVDESDRDPVRGHANPAPGPVVHSPGTSRYTFTSGTRPLEGYTIKRAVGRGGFGEVYYATSDSGKEVALKLITRNLEVERRGVVQCMNLKCPNLLAIHDIKTSDAGDTFVIMEYVAGPSLAHVLLQHPNGMPLDDVRAWLKGLVDGVSYLHDHGIVHRDLKPANLFMEEGVVKIGDYGLSKMISSQPASNHSESIGTCHYMAPEIASGKYHKPIDIYAMGVILFEMITGRVPFDGESVGEVLLKHLSARPNLEGLPEPYKQIIGRALSKDPAHRPQRVVDLLPAADAPRTQDVRFVGGSTPPGPAPVAPAKPVEEVFRISDEEPVLYIGPDTRPPRSTQRMLGIARGLRRTARSAPTPPRRPAGPPVGGRPVQLIATAPVGPPPLPPAPPPLPAGRVRVAELAGSMLAASFWSALATALVGIVAEIDFGRRPHDVAFVFTTILLGSWAALIPSKFAEGRTSGNVGRRLASGLFGLVLGVASQALADWTMMGPTPVGGPLAHVVDRFGSGSISLALPDLLRLSFFFAISFAAIDWWSMTDRDRWSRFRVGPLVRAGLLALAPGLVLLGPERSAILVPVVVLAGAVAQLVSPWSEQAARYTAATTRTRRFRSMA